MGKIFLSPQIPILGDINLLLRRKKIGNEEFCDSHSDRKDSLSDCHDISGQISSIHLHPRDLSGSKLTSQFI